MTNQSLKAVIIDDEAKARRIMEALIEENCPNVEVVATAEEVLTGIKAINKFKPDVVFLDIEMPGYTGFQLLDFFEEVHFDVIFTTAYGDYALKAFQVSAVDYLLKPIQIEQLKHAVEKATKLRGIDANNLERIKTLKDNLEEHRLKKIALPTSTGLVFIPVDDIVYLEADGSYTNIFLIDGKKMLISKKIKEFENMLIQDSRFFRTHRSYLINTTRIKAYVKHDGGHIVMENGDIAHLSREKKEEFNKLISDLKI